MPSVIVPLSVEGPYDEALARLRQVRTHIGQSICAIWSPPRWQPGPEEMVRETFDVEVLNASKRADAVHAVRQAVEVVDPERTILKGGGIDWEPVQ